MTEKRHVSPESDAFSTFAWGLRKYAWVVVATVLVLGVSIPQVLIRNTADRFDASAQVGPVTAIQLRSLDALPKTVETVFNNGAVAAAVRQELDVTDTTVVIPSRVELVAPQDNVIFTVVGHAANPEDAVNIANTAAGTLTEELNKYRDPVGTFAVQSSAAGSVHQIQAVSAVFLVLAGLASGLLVGLGIVAVLLTWRRPVLSAGTATRVTGAPVLGFVQLDGRAVRGLPQLCRRLLASGVGVVYLAGPESGSQERRRLATEMRMLLLDSDLEVVEGANQGELATRSGNLLTALVVPVGTPDSVLRREAELHLDPGSTGLVLVRRQARWKKPFSRPFRRGKKVAPPVNPSRHGAEPVGSKDSAMTSQ